MNRLDFNVKRSKFKVALRLYEHFWKHFHTDLFKAFTYFNETYHNYLLPGAHDTGNIFKVMGSKVKATGNIFDKCIPIDGLPSKNI